MDPLQRIVRTVAGSLLLALGVVLLVLPGPGLLLVLAGLVVLSPVFPRLERHLAPVRRRALRAARESVSSPSRIAGSVAVGAALVAGGVVWTVDPGLPLGGWPTGSGLILSGVVLLGLLVHSRRQVRAADGRTGED
ncbi:PGPGW domain-containing protein [Streptomyces sp. SL13]|uniref:PGPGW domain-containing protein n=1 Tax=Streptantibioticus silvisoli TaxID=2705255 RepID=A0AA90GUE8_9ACTN|nr:PGPGW domain-containing protein [Streptantibioticus silvisoli]MDI5961558.1 PGPGW domain-containing protein [Streptantibioticus silvisoli]MDI5968139.1 PGPGW domain-containing protein [Streptantibioticus silvisoli]